MLFVGDDWAEDHHDIEIVNEEGRRLVRRRLPEGLDGVTRLHALIASVMPEQWADLPAGGATARVKVGIETERGPWVTSLVQASRSVGSPQIRNRGTVGGNLGAASPAGDSHPALLAAYAHVEVESVRGARQIPAEEFYTGVKRNALGPDELIKAVLIAPPAGPQQFCKIGTRNAMVISVAAFGLALHPDREAVGTGIGSAAPTPRRALAAEQFLAQSLTDDGLWESRGALPDATGRHFADLVADAASPIDDVRGTARYRVHSLSVMARRALVWAWNDFRRV